MFRPHALTERGVFWVRPRSATRTVVSNGKMAFEESAANEDLVFSPADGGKPQVWRRGVPSPVSLYHSGAGLYLMTNRVEADMRVRSEVLRLSATDPNAPPADLSKALGVYVPVERGEYLYWMERFARRENEVSPNPLDIQESGRLIRCRLDGTDRRILWDGQDERGEPMRPGPFFFHQDRLYIQYALPRPGPPVAMTDPEIRAQTRIDTGARVAVLHPERTQTLGQAHVLPSAVQMLLSPNIPPRTALFHNALVDGGDLYVYVTEQKRSPLDFLSSRTTERNVLCLYRVPLPE